MLEDVLVVTVRKSFWASREAERFPRRLYARVFFGHSTNLFNSVVVFVRALFATLLNRPRILLLGSVERTVPWFIRARRLGLLGPVRLVVTNQLHLSEAQLQFVDRNVVYSQAWIDSQQALGADRAVFIPLPADGDLIRARQIAGDDGYVFAGGGTGRDFATLIEALRNTDLPLRIVTFSPETLGWQGDLPENVEVEWRMTLDDFLGRIARARLVVVPLGDPHSDFGQTTLVQSLSLGKPIVATKAPGVLDYVDDGHVGFLVDAGDVAGYRSAVLRLSEDAGLRRQFGARALELASVFSYAAFAERIANVCVSLLDA